MPMSFEQLTSVSKHDPQDIKTVIKRINGTHFMVNTDLPIVVGSSIFSGHDRWRCGVAVGELVEEGLPPCAQFISEKTGVPYHTVNRWFNMQIAAGLVKPVTIGKYKTYTLQDRGGKERPANADFVKILDRAVSLHMSGLKRPTNPQDGACPSCGSKTNST